MGNSVVEVLGGEFGSRIGVGRRFVGADVAKVIRQIAKLVPNGRDQVRNGCRTIRIEEKIDGFLDAILVEILQLGGIVEISISDGGGRIRRVLQIIRPRRRAKAAEFIRRSWKTGKQILVVPTEVLLEEEMKVKNVQSEDLEGDLELGDDVVAQSNLLDRGP